MEPETGLLLSSFLVWASAAPGSLRAWIWQQAGPAIYREGSTALARAGGDLTYAG